MFNYESLVDNVRRLLGDKKQSKIETVESFPNSSFYISLEEEGDIEIADEGLIINDSAIDTSSYTVTGNIIKLDSLIEVDSSVSINYSYQKYSDEEIIAYIGDTIKYTIQPFTSQDFKFGEDGVDETETLIDISKNYIGLFVNGTVLNILGVSLSNVASDAIYIKDGDTTINTAISSQEALKNVKPVYDNFYKLLKTVQSNMFSGIVLL